MGLIRRIWSYIEIGVELIRQPKSHGDVDVAPVVQRRAPEYNAGWEERQLTKAMLWKGLFSPDEVEQLLVTAYVELDGKTLRKAIEDRQVPRAREVIEKLVEGRKSAGRHDGGVFGF